MLLCYFGFPIWCIISSLINYLFYYFASETHSFSWVWSSGVDVLSLTCYPICLCHQVALMPSVGLRVAAFMKSGPTYFCFCSPPPMANEDGLLLIEPLPSASTWSQVRLLLISCVKVLLCFFDSSVGICTTVLLKFNRDSSTAIYTSLFSRIQIPYPSPAQKKIRAHPVSEQNLNPSHPNTKFYRHISSTFPVHGKRG
jgi:hypothetical protein